METTEKRKRSAAIEWPASCAKFIHLEVARFEDQTPEPTTPQTTEPSPNFVPKCEPLLINNKTMTTPVVAMETEPGSRSRKPIKLEFDDDLELEHSQPFPPLQCFIKTLNGRLNKILIERTSLGNTGFVPASRVFEQAEEVLGIPRTELRLLYEKRLVDADTPIPENAVLFMVQQFGLSNTNSDQIGFFGSRVSF